MPLRLLVLLMLLWSSPALGRETPRVVVNFPYTINTADGQQWIVQRGGWLQQQGNMPVYAQGANLTINGAGVQGNVHRGWLDKKTGELIVEGMAAGAFTVTRRILINKEENYARYIDIISARGAGEQAAAVMLQTSLNFGVNGGSLVNDPNNDGNAIGWIAPTGAGPVAAELWAGRGSKLIPEVNWQPGNSFVQVTYRVTIPAGGSVAIMHLHAVAASPESAEQFIAGVREHRLLASLPAEIRQAVVNFRIGGSFLGDRELLRGDSLDVIELRTGDQLRGTLEPQTYPVQTGFGLVELPAERVIGMLTAGAYRPRHLLITVDGEVIGGALQCQTIGLKLSSGQVTHVPISQIARVGCRKRDGEPEELTFTGPMLELRSGDRLAVEVRADQIDLLTRCGRVALPVEKIALLDLRSIETGVHVVTLRDGSRFGGLVQAEELSFRLSATNQPVTLPAGAIAMLRMTGEQPDVPADAARITLVGGDVLAAPLVGSLQLDTLFDTLELNAEEIVAMAPADTGGFDVQVTLWDQTKVSGQLRQGALRCLLGGSMSLDVPVPLLRSYQQPSPRPSPGVVERIRLIAADLSADDFARRERAQAQLVALGQIVVPLLQEWRANMPLEGQQRVDSILNQLKREE